MSPTQEATGSAFLATSAEMTNTLFASLPIWRILLARLHMSFDKYFFLNSFDIKIQSPCTHIITDLHKQILQVPSRARSKPRRRQRAVVGGKSWHMQSEEHVVKDSDRGLKFSRIILVQKNNLPEQDWQCCSCGTSAVILQSCGSHIGPKTSLRLLQLCSPRHLP